MDILGLMAVLSFGLTCFGLGYTLGKDSNKMQKYPPQRHRRCVGQQGKRLIDEHQVRFVLEHEMLGGDAV